MIANLINNKKLNSIVTDLFITFTKLDISLVFITQSYFKVSKDVRLYSIHFFIMKISNKRELQQIALSHYQTLTLKISVKSIKNVLLNNIPFWSMMLHLHQIIL